MKKNIQMLIAVATMGAGVISTPVAWGQTVDAGLGRQQQLEQERKQKQEQRTANKSDQQTTKADRREAKREREELSNMPKPVRVTLRSETQSGKDVDFYRVQGQGGQGAAGREFGAKFVAANGHQMDVRVDGQGKVLHRDDLTQAAATAAQAPATAAQQPAPAKPAPAPATPAPAPAPTASTEAPESGNAIYRRLQATDVPQNIRTIFEKDTTNAKDVRYYRTKYGSQLAYEAKWTDASGKDMRHYVSDAGQTLVRGESTDDDNAQTASNPTPAVSKPDANKPSNAIKTGRAELKDLPKAAQTQLRRLSEGGKDVKFYNTKYGSKQAYQATFTSRDGKDMSIIVDESGKVLSQKDDSSKKS